MHKIKLLLVRLLVIVLAVLVFVIAEVFYFGPQRLTVNYQQIQSTKIPKEFDQFSIAFISDLHYMQYINASNIQRLVNQMNLLQPDIIIFGGDLIDRPIQHPMNSEEKDALIDALKQMQAKDGKYAVLGNHDLQGLQTSANATEILEAGGFQMITNQNMRLYRENAAFIQIVGLDSMLLGHPDIPSAYANVVSSSFSLSVCHTPDIATDIPKAYTDLMLSGHSHGHQVYIPFISSFILPTYATRYSKGKYNVEGMLLHVSNGIGTTAVNARFLSNPEILFYRLQHMDKPIVTTLPVTTEPPVSEVPQTTTNAEPETTAVPQTTTKPEPENP